MSRSSGAGLMGFSIVLVIVGAVLEFAVTATTKGFNLNTVGMIMLIVGIVAFLVSLFMIVAGGSRRSSLHEDFRAVPGGHERSVEQRDSFASDI